MTSTKLDQQELVGSMLHQKGYVGIDVDLTISLFEYGVVVKDTGDAWKIIYTYYGDQDYYITQTVDKFFLADLINGMVDLGSITDYTGETLEQWLKRPFIVQLNDLIQYYGSLNIFGDPYNAKTLDQLYSDIVLEGSHHE